MYRCAAKEMPRVTLLCDLNISRFCLESHVKSLSHSARILSIQSGSKTSAMYDAYRSIALYNNQYKGPHGDFGHR